MFHLRKDSSVSYILAHPKITSGPTLGAKNVTQYYINTFLRYTEVDQTFGWARLAMSLKYIPCHWIGVIAQGMMK